MPSKLSFKGEKPKKKKRSHKETEDGADDLALMAAGDPRGWVFPEDILEINGPSYIILPTEPLTCLAVSLILPCEKLSVFVTQADKVVARRSSKSICSTDRCPPSSGRSSRIIHFRNPIDNRTNGR
jgi:hypothetical protein